MLNISITFLWILFGGHTCCFFQQRHYTDAIIHQKQQPCTCRKYKCCYALEQEKSFGSLFLSCHNILQSDFPSKISCLRQDWKILLWRMDKNEFQSNEPERQKRCSEKDFWGKVQDYLWMGAWRDTTELCLWNKHRDLRQFVKICHFCEVLIFNIMGYLSVSELKWERTVLFLIDIP